MKKMNYSENKIRTYYLQPQVIRHLPLLEVETDGGEKSYHRKQWYQNKLKHLSSVFSVEVCGYAIMNSCTHLCIRNRPDIAAKWTPEEVARRWWYLFPKKQKGTSLITEPKDYELEAILTDPKTGNPQGKLEHLRSTLASISSFMKFLNENISRRANREDGCKGAFWKSRYQSVELLDQAAVTAGLAFIELSLICTGQADSLETSDFSSGQDRIVMRNIEEKQKADLKNGIAQDSWLSPIYKWPSDITEDQVSSFLNMDFEHYSTLLNWTGKHFNSENPDPIPAHLSSVLTQMDIEKDSWFETAKHFSQWFFSVAGTNKSMAEVADAVQKKWLKGMGAAKKAFSSPPGKKSNGKNKTSVK